MEIYMNEPMLCEHSWEIDNSNHDDIVHENNNNNNNNTKYECMKSNNDDDVNKNDTIATTKDKDNDYNSIEKG